MINNRLYQKAIKFVEKNADLDGHFNFNGIDLFLAQCPTRNDHGTINGLPAEYQKRNNHFPWAVYIWQKLRAPIKRTILLHEIIEISTYVLHKKTSNEAHIIAAEYDCKYASENLTERDRKLVSHLRQRFS